MARDFEIKTDPEIKTIRLQLNEWNQDSLDAIHFRLVEGANKMRNKMINLMRRTPRTGKKYKRGKKFHIASSPGNAPAVDTGQLLRSIVMKEGIDYVEVGVKSGAPYAEWLEKGTKDGKIKPRPFLEPAANAIIPRIQNRILYDLERMKK